MALPTADDDEFAPTPAALWNEALAVIRANPSEYRQLKRDGVLEEAITLKVENAISYANSLISTGMFPG